jgi:hypothetical protein
LCRGGSGGHAQGGDEPDRGQHVADWVGKWREKIDVDKDEEGNKRRKETKQRQRRVGKEKKERRKTGRAVREDRYGGDR